MLVLGPTGYIGRFVTKELIQRGYKVTVFSREKAGVGGKKGKSDVEADFPGAHRVVFGDVKVRQEGPRRSCASDAPGLQSRDSLRYNAFDERVDVIVSCLASRTGGVQVRQQPARVSSAFSLAVAGLVGH